MDKKIPISSDEFLQGKKFGFLTYVGNNVIHKRIRKSLWKCDCGNEVVANVFHVIHGTKKSCNQCNLARSKNNSSLWKGFNEISGTRWGSLIFEAQRRKLKFSITIEYAWNQFIKQNRKCALTGELITFDKKQKLLKHATASLDRIDSTKGYIEGNVQWVHKDINFMKYNFSQEYFKELCRKVVNYEQGLTFSKSLIN